MLSFHHPSSFIQVLYWLILLDGECTMGNRKTQGIWLNYENARIFNNLVIRDKLCKHLANFLNVLYSEDGQVVSYSKWSKCYFFENRVFNTKELFLTIV